MATGNSCDQDATCAVCLQEHVLPVRLPCSHVYCFLCAKGLFLKGRHCALCRTRIADDFFRHPESAMLSGATNESNNSVHAAADAQRPAGAESGNNSRNNPAKRTSTQEDEDTKPVISELGQKRSKLVGSQPSDEDVDVKVDADSLESFSHADHNNLSGSASSAPVKQPEERYCWYYAGRNGWWKYDERTNAELERVFSATPDGDIDILIVGTLYHIDLSRLVQFQRENPTLKRRIKRDRQDALSLGVAGLKLLQPSDDGAQPSSCSKP